MGTGDNYVSIAAFDYGDSSKTPGKVSAGSGRDTLNVTAGAVLDSDLMANVTGFEVLDIGGGDGTAYAVKGLGFSEVTISKALTAAGTVNGITNETLSITASETQGITYVIDGATASSSASVTIAGDHVDVGADGDTSNDTNDLTVKGITIATVGTVNIESNTDSQNEAGVTNTITALTTAAAKTLNVTGDHTLTIAGFANNATITTINAEDAAGLIMGAGLKTATAVSITGSAGNDTLVIDAARVGGNTLNPGKGGNIVTLGANATRDTLIINKGDSQIGYTDTNSDGAYVAAGDAETFDIITGFVSGTDLLDLGSFEFTGQKQSALATQTLTAAQIVELVDGATSEIADFFKDTGVVRGVATVSGVNATSFGGAASSTVVFIDSDGSGSLEVANDDMIVLSGTASVALADFGF